MENNGQLGLGPLPSAAPRAGLRPISNNVQQSSAASQNAGPVKPLATSSLLDGFVPGALVDKENWFNKHASEKQQDGKLARGRRSLTGLQFQDDLAKLRSEFDILNQQLQQMPRRESQLGSHVPQPSGQQSGHFAPPLPPAPMSSVVPVAPVVSSNTTSVAVQRPPVAPVHCINQPAAPLAAPAAQVSNVASLLPASLTSLAASNAANPVNDCVLLGSKEPKPSEKLFQFPANNSNSKALKAASEVFEEAELTTLCDDGLHKQLQRTKDGATEQSRIQELAGLVKLLRKCMRELGSRTSLYVDQCMKLEKDLMKQIETVQLSSECSVKALEAELAGAKKSLAQFEASFKMDKATWGTDLETQKFEISRLKRELERVSEERDSAREDAKRAEQLRQQLEVELKELRKQASQQMREVSVNQSEVVRAITEEKLAAERREERLKDESTRMQQRLEAAGGCIEALQAELAMMRQVQESLQDSLKCRVANEEGLGKQVAQLQHDLSECKAQLAVALPEVQRLQGLLDAAQQQVAQQGTQLEERARELHTTQQRLSELNATFEAEKASWSEEKRQLLAAQAAAAEREQFLTEEKGMLKAALTATLGQKEEAEMRASTLQREQTALNNENMNLKHQVDFASGQQAQAEAQAANLQASLNAAHRELEATRVELQEKDERLAHLEGEFTALKEVLGGDAGQRDVVAGLLSRISSLQSAVAAADAVRRKLHNELVEIRGNIRVYCRVRPHPSTVVRCMPDQTSVQIAVDGKDHGFGYDRVFAPNSSQEEVFSAVSELVQSALDGYHVCLFSYGQTGAGKTFTMQGTDSPSGRGIIPRAVEKILETANQLRDQEYEFTMEASFIEIYNNMLRDLLGGQSAGYINDQNAIKHDPAGGHTSVVGVSKVPVMDMASAEALIRRAAASRACEATAMNAVSSRSHSVFMLYITGQHPPTGTRLQGCLCLVDLAGSERLDRSQVEDQRKKEACAINQSLSALGDIFAALSAKTGHVPYRNSKLTYLLQPCLGGQGKTLMFVNINPEPASAFETLCSLKFAAKVNGCETGAKGGAKRNVVGGGAVASAATAASAGGDVKRMSLPGPPRAAAGGIPSMGEPAAKRMSLIGPARTGSGSSSGLEQHTGFKRPASSGIPLAGGLAKKAKQ